MFTVKTVFQKEFHRFNLDAAKFAELLTVIQQTYNIKDPIIRYMDEDKDLISINSDLELEEGFRVSQGFLKLYITTKTENVSDDNDGFQFVAIEREEINKEQEEPKEEEPKEEEPKEEEPKEEEPKEEEPKEEEPKEEEPKEQELKEEEPKEQKEEKQQPKEQEELELKIPSCVELSQMIQEFISSPEVEKVLPGAIKAGLDQLVTTKLSGQNDGRSVVEEILSFDDKRLRQHPIIQKLLPLIVKFLPKVDKFIENLTPSVVELLSSVGKSLFVNVDCLRSLIPWVLGGAKGDLDLDLATVDLTKVNVEDMSEIISTVLASTHPNCSQNFDADLVFSKKKLPEVKVHDGVCCDNCNVFPIVGVRYKCSVCDDFDLCATCESKDCHPAAHPLIKYKVPNNAHHGIICDGCGVTPISGDRFKCLACPDYDLCTTCEEKGIHPEDHPMMKIRVPDSFRWGHHGRWGRRRCARGFRGHCRRQAQQKCPVQESPVEPVQVRPPVQEQKEQQQPGQEEPVQEPVQIEEPVQEEPVQEEPVQEDPVQIEDPVQQQPVQQESESKENKPDSGFWNALQMFVPKLSKETEVNQPEPEAEPQDKPEVEVEASNEEQAPEPKEQAPEPEGKDQQQVPETEGKDRAAVLALPVAQVVDRSGEKDIIINELEYPEQFEILKQMGFLDQWQVMLQLKKHKGDVQATALALLEAN
jgi:hypothetical protein